MKSFWRNRSAVIIATAIRDGQSQALDGPALKKFVSARYPFGERAMHPYKIWLSELNRQLGTPKRPRKPTPAEEAKREAWDKATGQLKMFTNEGG